MIDLPAKFNETRAKDSAFIPTMIEGNLERGSLRL